MSNTLRNTLIAITILLFGGSAISDGMHHSWREALRDLGLGMFLCVMLVRISQGKQKPTSKTF
jgi:hypothetical protein